MHVTQQDAEERDLTHLETTLKTKRSELATVAGSLVSNKVLTVRPAVLSLPGANGHHR